MAGSELMRSGNGGARLADHFTPEELDFISAYMRLMGIERIGFRTALAIVWGVESANGAKRTDKAD